PADAAPWRDAHQQDLSVTGNAGEPQGIGRRRDEWPGGFHPSVLDAPEVKRVCRACFQVVVGVATYQQVTSYEDEVGAEVVVVGGPVGTQGRDRLPVSADPLEQHDRSRPIPSVILAWRTDRQQALIEGEAGSEAVRTQVRWDQELLRQDGHFLIEIVK